MKTKSVGKFFCKKYVHGFCRVDLNKIYLLNYEISDFKLLL